MNYEELLAARSAKKPQKTKLPIGSFYREQQDGKWRSFIDIDTALNQNIVFSKSLQAECNDNVTLASTHQIHFSPVTDSQGDIIRLELEQGTFLPLEQLLAESPAIVAHPTFIDSVMSSLVDITTYLHDRNIRHLCFSPSTVFIRKGTQTAMLLSHGSYYENLSDLEAFFGNDAKYVAPEVLTGGTIDDKSDVYSLGKFMESLFDGDMPREYRAVASKATSEKPEDRYNTPADMLKALKRKRETFRMMVFFLAALALSALIIWAYFDAFPETTTVEYVKPVPRQATDDLIDDGFDPSELGVMSADSVRNEEAEIQRTYQAKAEEIFRKKYEAEADRILSKIYNTGYMSNSEKKFMTESESTIQELMKVQQQLTDETNLEPTRAQVIASDIIERLTEQKKKQIGSTNSRGVQTGE